MSADVTLRLSPFELESIIGAISKDKTIPRTVWLKLYIASSSVYLNHPTYGEQARQNVVRWQAELSSLQSNDHKEHEPEAIWVTKTGEKIPVRLMTDDHIIRSIRLLRRRAVERIVFDEALQTVDYLLKRTKINILLAEAKKRRLSIIYEE